MALFILISLIVIYDFQFNLVIIISKRKNRCTDDDPSIKIQFL